MDDPLLSLKSELKLFKTNFIPRHKREEPPRSTNRRRRDVPQVPILGSFLGKKVQKNKNHSSLCDRQTDYLKCIKLSNN